MNRNFKCPVTEEPCEDPRCTVAGALRVDERAREAAMKAAVEAGLQARIVPARDRWLKGCGQDPVTGRWYRRDDKGRWVEEPPLVDTLRDIPDAQQHNSTA